MHYVLLDNEGFVKFSSYRENAIFCSKFTDKDPEEKKIIIIIQHIREGYARKYSKGSFSLHTFDM